MHWERTHRISQTVTVYWTGTSMGRKSESWHGSIPFDVRWATTTDTAKGCMRNWTDPKGTGHRATHVAIAVGHFHILPRKFIFVNVTLQRVQ